MVLRFSSVCAFEGGSLILWIPNELGWSVSCTEHQFFCTCSCRTARDSQTQASMMADRPWITVTGRAKLRLHEFGSHLVLDLLSLFMSLKIGWLWQLWRGSRTFQVAASHIHDRWRALAMCTEPTPGLRAWAEFQPGSHEIWPCAAAGRSLCLASQMFVFLTLF